MLNKCYAIFYFVTNVTHISGLLYIINETNDETKCKMFHFEMKRNVKKWKMFHETLKRNEKKCKSFQHFMKRNVTNPEKVFMKM